MSKTLTEAFFRLESFLGPWYLWCMKQFENRWIYEFFAEKSDAIIKSMFGGLALYYQGQLKFLLSENPGDYSYRGQKYDFEIWNGVLIATDRIHHDSLLKQFPFLVNHPVLPKWLYLPFTFEGWEDRIELILRLAKTSDPRVGIWPQEKSRKKSKVAKKSSKKKVTQKKVAKKAPRKLK
ncbi:hypothetical protein [Bdellovibrio bacteriovorus]|uniref:hypothetical protein n=1 Tax=Bdellovibrio bacteriovorus TaxID=959 RepID=UPI0035A70DE7